MSNIINFDFNSHAVRVVTIEGEPWFVTKDVCRVLNLKPDTNGSYSPRLKALAEGEKATLERRDTPNYHTSVGSLFGQNTARISLISESGLYKLVLRAHRSNPAAARFQDWVTREVLPAIRKDGAYVMGEEKLRSGEMSEDEFVLKAMSILQGKVSRLTQELAEAKPKADLVDAHYNRGLVSLNRFARTLPGCNSNRIKADLLKAGFLYLRAGTYRVYSRYRDSLFIEKRSASNTMDIYPTTEGRQQVVQLYNGRKLSMRKGSQVRAIKEAAQFSELGDLLRQTKHSSPQRTQRYARTEPLPRAGEHVGAPVRDRRAHGGAPGVPRVARGGRHDGSGVHRRGVLR